jgi:hypothetical protein
MHCLNSKAFAALSLCIGLGTGAAAVAQPSGPLASGQLPAGAGNHYAAQAAGPAMHETTAETGVLASEQGLDALNSAANRAPQVDRLVLPQATQALQPLASDSPAVQAEP